jgi:hypothetical protein
MFSEIRDLKREYPDALLIGLLHHPFNSSDPSEVIQNPSVFLKNLSEDIGSVVTLSGHVHGDACTLTDRVGVTFLEIVASTVTKAAKDRTADTLRGFNMIELKRSHGRVVSVSVSCCQFQSLRMSITNEEVFTREPSGRLIRKND